MFDFLRVRDQDQVDLRSRLKRRYLDLDQPISDVRFVSFDTETTGFAPRGGDEIISLGAVAVHGPRMMRSQNFYRLVNPGRSVPAVVSNLTGLCEEMLYDKLDFIDVFQEFLDFAGDCVLLGHGVHFDLEFINYRLHKFCRSTVQAMVVDTRLIYQTLFPELSRYSLDYLLELNQIEPVGRHNALGDAILTAQLFQGLFPIFPKVSCTTLRDLRRLSRPH